MAAQIDRPRNLKDLSREELESQLTMCWEHFRRCVDALNGNDVSPCNLISLDELGDSDDLELFYLCKERAE